MGLRQLVPWCPACATGERLATAANLAEHNCVGIAGCESGCNPLHACQVNTRTYRGRSKILVGIGILTSYERMGMAQLVCESGCDCEPVQMNGHTDDQFSQSGWFYHSGTSEAVPLHVLTCNAYDLTGSSRQ